mgnify:CR=1 FL=1
MPTPTRIEFGSQSGSDERYQVIDRAMQQYAHRPDALLEALHAAQETFGYLSEEVLTYIAGQLGVPLSRVYGVATFYDLFSLEPTGETHCLICTDPACAIAGAEDVLKAACARAGIDGAGQTSANGKVSVRRAACLGLCDQAPAALVNGIAQVNLRAGEADALLRGEAARSRINVTGDPRVLTRLIGALDPLDLDAHRAEGAFAALEKALTAMTPEGVVAEVKASSLAGRGGAGFPTGLKWESTRAAAGTPKYVVCNFDESEPGTFKDRAMMQGDPFRVIEGLILSAYATGAEQGYIFVRGEYPEATAVLHEAIDRLYGAGLLGENILGSGFRFDLDVRRGAGAYICGEETALFEAIEGRRGHPRTKPPYPTTHGLFDKPTSINNVETLAIVPDVVQNGGAWLRQWGTEKSVGIKLFCLSGHVQQPGVVEAPYGITIRELIERFGGGFVGQPQAVLMGGAAGGFLHPDKLDTPLTHEALNPLGAPIGSGVVMVFNTGVDLWSVLKGLAHFFVHETCGRCVPCRLGTYQIHTLLDRITAGAGTSNDLAQLEEIGGLIRRSSVCGLGMTAANPVLTTLRAFDLKV